MIFCVELVLKGTRLKPLAVLVLEIKHNYMFEISVDPRIDHISQLCYFMTLASNIQQSVGSRFVIFMTHSNSLSGLTKCLPLIKQ